MGIHTVTIRISESIMHTDPLANARDEQLVGGVLGAKHRNVVGAGVEQRVCEVGCQGEGWRLKGWELGLGMGMEVWGCAKGADRWWGRADRGADAGAASGADRGANVAGSGWKV